MTTVNRTACSRDCPDVCSLVVTVEDGRAVSLKGDPGDPVTRGFLCERTGRFLDRQYAAERITRPLARQGGELVPVSWDAALDLAAERLLAAREQHGPASILHYRSGGSLGILKTLSDHLFERFGPVTVKRGDICSGAGEAAQELDFGVCDSHDLFDLRHSRTILVWGKNPHTSGVHLLPLLKEARARGAVILGVDPVRTKLAAMCDLFVQPRPGGDLALAMGMLGELFERGWDDAGARATCHGVAELEALSRSRSLADWAAEADVAQDDLRRMAEHYGTGAPAALLVGWGLARRRHGAATVRALDALGAVSGNLGVPGGGVSYSFRRQGSFSLDFLGGLDTAPRSLSEARLGTEILEAADPPVRAAWITAGNPVSMLPESDTVRRALSSLDFVAVVDTHPTDTTDVADLVLPTLTLLEDEDVLGSYGNHWLRRSRAALAPPGDGEGPRHELHILQGLAQRLGVGEALAGSVDDWIERVTRDLSAAGVDVGSLADAPVRDPTRPEVLFLDGRFPTPDGKARLLTELPEDRLPGCEGFPLTLLAVSTPRAQSSQWSVARPVGPTPVRVHPAAAEGFDDGAEARLESALGSLSVVVVHDERVRPDVALMEKGGMLRTGGSPNALVAARETDAGGGAVYYDEPVRMVTGG